MTVFWKNLWLQQLLLTLDLEATETVRRQHSAMRRIKIKQLATKTPKPEKQMIISQQEIREHRDLPTSEPPFLNDMLLSVIVSSEKILVW